MENTKTFAHRLAKALEHRDKKPIDLTNNAGLNKSLISGYLNGRYEAKNDKIDIISEYLNINPLYLMGLQDDFGKYTDINIESPSPYGDHKANLEYFADKPELLEIYKEIHDSESLQLLFDSAKDLTPEALESVLQIIKQIKVSNQ